MNHTLIGLDADGVLLDYNSAYAKVWAKAFGIVPALSDPLGYHARDRYQLAELSGSELEYFRSFFNAEFWTHVPAISGAIDACKVLSAAGFDLVCVSALPKEFEAERLKNLQSLGFPIDRVVATPASGLQRSPKSLAIKDLMPVAFVDDYAVYLQDMPLEVHKALLLRDPNNSPNDNPRYSQWIDSRHSDLSEFSNWWLSPERALGTL